LGQSPPPLNRFLSSIEKLGFTPNHILDVGANHGDWTRTSIQYFPDAHYTLVEPQDDLKVHVSDLLSARKVEWINAGASDTSGTLWFTIATRDHSSTFVNSGESEGAQRIQLPVRTLNEIVASSRHGLPEMVKIDAEGFDLKALRGASNLLGRSEIIFAEVGLAARDIENNAAAVVNFMNDAGYRMIDITDINVSPRHKLTWVCEFAFIRNQSHLLDSIISYE
jgi:FkbM family methyltransferase